MEIESDVKDDYEKERDVHGKIEYTNTSHGVKNDVTSLKEMKVAISLSRKEDGMKKYMHEKCLGGQHTAISVGVDVFVWEERKERKELLGKDNVCEGIHQQASER